MSNPSVNIYHSLSRACYQSNARTLQDLIDRYDVLHESNHNHMMRGNDRSHLVDLNNRVYPGIPFVLDDNMTIAQGQSLMVLAVKYSDRRVTRLLLEQGVDVESEDLYATALRGQWRSDWSEKANMLIEAAEINVSDTQKLLRDHRLYYLPNIIQLFEYLREEGNWYCLENLLHICYEQHLRIIPGELCDNEKKAFDRLFSRYKWLLKEE